MHIDNEKYTNIETTYELDLPKLTSINTKGDTFIYPCTVILESSKGSGVSIGYRHS